MFLQYCGTVVRWKGCKRTEKASHRPNQEYYVNIYPILENGQVNGTISIVTTLEISRMQDESTGLTLKERVHRFEIAEIEKMLNLYGHDLKGKKITAEKLGISLSSLYAKLQEQ